VQHDLLVRTEPARGAVAVLGAAGVVDAHTLDKFEAALAAAANGGARAVVLDLDAVHYVNSAGFGELIRWSDRLHERGGALVLARVPPKVRVILEMLGLESVIPVAPSVEEALALAMKPPSAPSSPSAPPPPSREPSPAPSPASAPHEGIVACAFCDTRLRVSGSGRFICAGCGAPFSLSRDGGVAFDWSRADSDAIHVTFDVTPRNLAAFAGLLEGILTERRVPHARTRRFAREAAHVCHLLAERAYSEGPRGPLHVLAQAGPQRILLRIVERGRRLGAEAAEVFAQASRLFLDFRYASHESGANVTEFAFAYEGSGVFAA
jgi:anti-anti-sigma factor